MDAFHTLENFVEEHTLSRSLPAALRIANAIEDGKWAGWLKLELMGYLGTNPEMTKDTVVPEYRDIPGQWCDDFGRVFIIEQSDLGFINHLRLRDGVTVLEGFAAGVGTMLTRREIGFADIIRGNLGVEVTTFEFSSVSVQQVLTNIKVQLLDRMMQRRDKIRALPQPPTPQSGEILQLKPTIYGVGIDLKALWRRMYKGIR